MLERPFFRTLACCVATALFLVVAGCDDDAEYIVEPPLQFVIQRNSIEKTIEAFELVWRHQLYLDYEALLHDQFEFFPLEEDAPDFPWMVDWSWARMQELRIASHMFDPNFSGENQPINAIEIDLTEISRRDIAPNHVEVDCILQGRVLTSATDGWSFDTRVLIEIVPDPEEPGLFQVIKQTEVPSTNPLPSIDSTSWGSIKSSYY
jgi:hypothetical protein